MKKSMDCCQGIKRRVAVMGAARSGLAAVKVLKAMDRDIFLSDTSSEDTVSSRLREYHLTGIDYESGKNSERILEYDQIIVSPGVPLSNNILEKACRMGIPVWSEIELGYRLCRGRVIAVTGSTGKSTTVSLIGEALKKAGIDNRVCGNIGLPFSEVAQEIPEDGIAVVEVSSFQLESVVEFKPDVAVILNLYKNHLDRYKGEEEYYNAKKDILKNLSSTDTAVLFSRDSRLREWGEGLIKGKLIYFGDRRETENSVWWKENNLYLTNSQKTEKIGDLTGALIPGDHNRINMCAAAAALTALDIDPCFLERALKVFRGLEHRMEYVGEFSGTSYYNDSKATTVESIRAALTAFQDNVVLIAGGRDKGCDFSLIKEDVKSHVMKAILLGEAKERIKKEWEGATEIAFADSMKDAVEKAGSMDQSNYNVILSPGCSSFDMFDNYRQRGEVYKNLVKRCNRG